MGVVRLFCFNEDYGKPSQDDVDQFYLFFRTQNCYEEDLTFKIKYKEPTKDSEVFLQEKYAARKAKDPNTDLPKRIHVQEVKVNQTPPNKLQVTNITWGPAKSQLLGATFKHKPTLQSKDPDFQSVFIVWNYTQCKKLCHIDLGSLTVSHISFNPFNPSTILISGDQSYLLNLQYSNANPVPFESLSPLQLTQTEEKKQPPH